MESKRSLSIRLIAGLTLSLAALALYAGYTETQLRVLRRLQTDVIERNRRDSLLLVRVLNDLNTLGLGMRDLLDAKDGYPLTAWRAQFQRIRTDLDDALQRESAVAPVGRTADQASYLSSSMAQFWDAMDRMFALAASNEPEARDQVRISLQARQAALTTAVYRLLVQNNAAEEEAGMSTRQIHAQVERNLYIFFGVMLAVLGVIFLWLIGYHRRLFDRLTALSQRRSELAQQLIRTQESTFASISRDLHDDFGQILTAVGSMLQRAGKLATTNTSAMVAELREIHEVVQGTLEKVRSLSQALHPVMLEEVGFESALDTYIPVFERRSGIHINYTKTGESRELGREPTIHVYRVLQEALNNVARHSGAHSAEIRLTQSADAVTLEIEDDGAGFDVSARNGLGLISMRERAEMIGGHIEYLRGASGGALVRLSVPVSPEASHAAGVR